MKENKRIIPTIREAQDVMGIYSEKIDPGETSLSIMEMLKDEVTELEEALHGKDKKGIKGELGDCMLLLLRIAGIESIPAEEAIAGKVARNLAKYPPHEIANLVAQGATYREARGMLKDNWDKSKDKDYL